ncbi:hypothetical protein BOX15_Mlig020920g1 [Macrostomum lignano]|uniref:Cation-transporting ATPase n=2 Tax=Macrostomum lignano TaxID=282301 RepID=A0A267FY89_9PLAT|nr:hypothetical protein BOX15_Mlig020920g1 [Macrostomum lignano]
MTSILEYTINKGEDDESKIIGYKKSTIKTVLTYIGYGCTLFLLRLLFFWLPRLHIKCTQVPCALHEADSILVRDQYKQLFVEDVVIVSTVGVKLRKSGIAGSKTDKNGRLHSARCSTKSPCVDGDSAAAAAAASLTSLDNARSTAVLYSSSCPGVPVESTFRYFMHKKIKYVWQSYEQRFKRNDVFINTSCEFFHETTGLDEAEANLEFVKYGENRVHIPLTPIWKLLVVQNERNLRKTLVDSSSVSAVRGSTSAPMELDSSRLVPGDIIEIPQSGCLMQCDAVLIAGNCIVNESMLTGESVPLLKTPIPSVDSQFSLKRHAKHILFCGTKVIQTRHSEPVRAVVVRTGFMTSKGELVRSILYPKPIAFTFNRDVINYLEVLGLFAVAGFIYTVILMHQRGDAWQKIVVRALDLITIAVPPALPAAMTIGIVFAQTRLKRRKIFCIAPKTINVSGAINLVCFDKTGTLTESGMDLWGAVPALKSVFLPSTSTPVDIKEPSQLLEAMATCHALTRIDGVLSGDPLDLKMFESTGWLLDEPNTINYSRCDRQVSLLVRSPSTGTELGIIRQFPFSSELQRMSVIAIRLGALAAEPLVAFVKGSPEMIHSLCLPDSIPADFHNQLMEYTSHGYRVIALAYRPLSPSVSLQSAQKLNRGEFEYDLQFLGLLVMENRLKPETVGSIGTLLGAKIRPVMVTGDNILTALSVARECGIIADTEAAVIVQTSDGPNGPNVNFVVYGDPRRRVTEAAVLSPSSPYRLAISGASWQAVRQHFSQLIPRLAVCGAVFARFSPVQKSQLVECLQELGYTVAMCGDGANDCGALKTAHAGISLSEAEASVASPFTSKEQNISCVIRLIQEGRCALVTSFGIFKFMACYSMCQFVSVLILYWIATNLTDNQFVYIDLFIITTLFVTFSYTAACESIAQEAPSHRLLSFVTCSSIALQCGIFVAFQTLAYFYVRWQSWFYPFVYDSNSDQMACYENTAVFLISVNQYIILAVVFSKSAPYRRSMLTNYAFMINIAIVVGVNLFVIFAPTDWLGNLLETWDAPRDNPNLSIKFVLVGAILMNFLIAFLVEQLVESVWFSRLVHRAGRRLISKPKEFERVARQLKLERGEWPPISVHFQRTGQRELLNFVAQGGGGSADEAVKPNQVSVEIKPMEADRPRADSEQQKKKKKKKYYTAL